MAGLQNRILYGPSFLALVRDVISILLENNLVLVSWQSLLTGASIISFRDPCLHNRHRHDHRIVAILQSILRILLCLGLLLIWILASWGDYMFQVQTHGVLPSLWIIAAGLKNPSVHLQVQLQPEQRIVFLGAACRILKGLAVAIVLLLYSLGSCEWFQWRNYHSTTADGDGSATMLYHFKDKDYDIQESVDLPETAIHGNHPQNNESKRPSSEYFRVNLIRTRGNRRLLLGNLSLLLFFYSFCESWAPVTNFTFALMGSMVLVPLAASRSSCKKSNIQPSSEFAKASSSSSRPPNVVLIVHESLSGAALETTLGKAATPFYQSLMKEDDMYFFRYPRTVAGTTTIATPAILTGLLAYDLEGVDVLKEATLATDFKVQGYDTASFVSYGTDWYGSGWAILSDLLRNDFDHLFGVSFAVSPFFILQMIA
jgi:hypothetical protein